MDSGIGSQWRVVLVGGYANHGTTAGAFFVISHYGSSDAYANIGRQLSFSGLQ